MKRSLRYSFYVLILFTTICLSACKKDFTVHNSSVQNQEQRALEAFTRLPINADQEMKLIVANIVSTEQQTHFLVKFAEKNGYPVWDKMLANTNYSDQVESLTSSPTVQVNGIKTTLGGKKSKTGFFLIPLIDTTSREVKSFMACEKKSDSAYTYKVYNKETILHRAATSDTPRADTKPLLAHFAFFEKTINHKKTSTFSGKKKYTFSNVNITHTNPSNSASIAMVQRVKSNVLAKVNALAAPCPRGILDIIVVDYGDGTYDVFIILTDCLTLPDVTVTSGGGGGSSGSSSSYGPGYTGPISGSGYTGFVDPSLGGVYTSPPSGSGTSGPYDPYMQPVGFYYDPSSPYWGATIQDPYSPENLAAYAQSLGNYWIDPSYDAVPFPPYDPATDGPRDADGYRKNGPVYSYVGGSVQNYTDDNGGKYAIFTSTSGVQTKFPGATVTDFGVLSGAGVTTSNGGIHLSQVNNGLEEIEHEYGHYLQAQQLGSFYYNTRIVPASLLNAWLDPSGHRFYWTETDANRRSAAFFGPTSAIATSTYYPK